MNRFIRMMGTGAVAIALTLATLSTAGAERKRMIPVSLKQGISVSGNAITLADLFVGAEDAGEYKVAAAPEPGKKTLLNPSAIARMAYYRGYIWRAPAGLRRIVVRRASRLIPSQDIVAAISEALTLHTNADRMDVDLGNRGSNIHVGLKDTVDLLVESISYSATSNRFTAILASRPADMQGATGQVRRFRVTGRGYELVEIPVLAQRVRAGQAIRDTDIDWKEIRKSKLHRQAVRDLDELVGMSPRRSIGVGRPIRISDLQRPVAVPKGSIVTMFFNAPGISLTATGRAEAAGGIGDVIRIMNTRSRKTVEAEIIAPGKAVINTITSRRTAALIR